MYLAGLKASAGLRSSAGLKPEGQRYWLRPPVVLTFRSALRSYVN
jgi:hypothetical protein